jgi:hypothetical protein
MGEPNTIDDSDRATGLPPLTIVEGQPSVYVTSYATQLGTMNGEAFVQPVPVRWLSVRGFTVASPEDIARGKLIAWVQHHIAINANNALDLAASLTSGETVAPPPTDSDAWLDALKPCAKVLAERLPGLIGKDGAPNRDAVNAAMALLIEARSVFADGG